MFTISSGFSSARLWKYISVTEKPSLKCGSPLLPKGMQCNPGIIGRDFFFDNDESMIGGPCGNIPRWAVGNRYTT